MSDEIKENLVAWLKRISQHYVPTHKLMGEWIAAHQSGADDTADIELKLRKRAAYLVEVLAGTEVLNEVAAVCEVKGAIDGLRKAATNVRDTYGTSDELYHAQDQLFWAWQRLKDAFPSNRKAGKEDREEEPPPPPLEPVEMLTNWHEITDALKIPHEQREKVKSLNDRLDGPIPKVRKGGQPIVERAKLVEWWNKMTIRQQELANQRNGAKLDAEAVHDYGRGGQVAPGVGGGVKKRRSDHKR